MIVKAESVIAWHRIPLNERHLRGLLREYVITIMTMLLIRMRRMEGDLARKN